MFRLHSAVGTRSTVILKYRQYIAFKYSSTQSSQAGLAFRYQEIDNIVTWPLFRTMK